MPYNPKEFVDGPLQDFLSGPRRTPLTGPKIAVEPGKQFPVFRAGDEIEASDGNRFRIWRVINARTFELEGGAVVSI
jgi:hypothetical protein